MHHPDPVLDRGARRVDRDLLAVDEDLARVGMVEPVEDVHQRRLAGAVLAEQRVHLAGQQVEVDPVVREHAGEALRDLSELENRRGVGHPRDSMTRGRRREKEPEGRAWARPSG